MYTYKVFHPSNQLRMINQLIVPQRKAIKNIKMNLLIKIYELRKTFQYKYSISTYENLSH